MSFSVFVKVDRFFVPTSVAYCPECGGRLVFDGVGEKGNINLVCAFVNRYTHTGKHDGWSVVYAAAEKWLQGNIRVEV